MGLRHCNPSSWVFVLLLAVAMAGLALGGCGSSPTHVASPSASAISSSSEGTQTLLASTAGLHVPLISLVVETSPGFGEAETAYLSRCNMAWRSIQRTCVAAASAGQSEPAAAKDVVRTVASTSALWMRAKAPSKRFAPLHRQVMILAKRLHGLSELARDYGAAVTQADKDALAARLETSGASIAVLADRVASKSENLRDKYGEASYPEPVVPVGVTYSGPAPTDESVAALTVAATPAEKEQVKAIAEDSVWITEPLAEAQAMMEAAPVNEWGLGDVYAFCLDMGFIQATCQDWMKKKPAGPNIAYYFDQYIAGLTLLNKAAGELINMAENESLSAGRRGAADLEKATPYIERAMVGFKAILPSAFK